MLITEESMMLSGPENHLSRDTRDKEKKATTVFLYSPFNKTLKVI